ncbi:glucuronate isomerase [Streptosporangium becharense]|uniref:Uronate isomerase n=1 Tax=Streptosporangium becharense TaxID=1816182 RepID=A0A7W9IB75_9ACTN|nr:glucuronate isomerase [Streptosporangium becharense]MBB2914174.1 glucuronate isomerase [Streptosporangium becharense]MBB5817201.1 glucuronate isomerase [Streptosporangium becharense]
MSLRLHPDRLLPADPRVRAVARRLYAAVEKLPILSPHGHVDPRLLVDDEPFGDPAALLISPDHYVTRLLHACGVPLGEPGVGRGPLPEADARHAWRRLCEHWAVFGGTPVRYWLEAELAGVFGVTERPSAGSADRIYDRIAARLAEPAYRPRALFERFGIEVLATTDDPCDDLAAHRTLAADPGWTARVVPTFRPDRYLEPGREGWAGAVARLGEVAGTDTSGYDGYLRALEARRRHFIEHGATSADHSHADVRTDPLPRDEAARIYRAALAGTAGPAETTAFRRHMLLETARMSAEDGLVMTLHPAVRRGHHTPTHRRYGPDTGHDIPIRAEFTDALRPLLERYGTAEGFQLVLFTLDETVFSREIAPLAGFYPSVYAGAPWWFLDAPDAIRRFRRAVTETAGFSRTSGFVDDTRAFCSIPARHDMSRRLDCGFLAELVAEHRLEEDEAARIAVELVTVNPRRAFKL